MDPILDRGTDYGIVNFSAHLRDNLYEAARWGKFLAIVGFVFIGLMVLLGLGMGIFMSSMSSQLGPDSGMAMFGSGLMTFFYVLIAVLYFFPTLYLFRFSTDAMAAIQSDSQRKMEQSFANLKSLFKFMGILTIILLCFYGISLLFGLIVGASAAF